MKSSKFWVVISLLVVTVAIMQLRGDVDKVPSSMPLSSLPTTIGPLTSTDVPIESDVLQVLGKGVFLNRLYFHPEEGVAGRVPQSAPVGLFIGYFPTQRTGQAIHSPQNCLPGSGWTFESSGVIGLRDENGKNYKVGEYVISDGKVRQEVLYWYRVHGRSIASDYLAKLYTLADSIRYSRTDAALVRVITTVQFGESREAARTRAVSFAEQMAPLLPAYIPD